MSSVTKTGINDLPLYTERVTPTKSGIIVDLLDQVLIGVLEFSSFDFFTFF